MKIATVKILAFLSLAAAVAAAPSCAVRPSRPEFPEAELMWVGRPDGTLTCNPRQAETLESVGQDLADAAVRVVSTEHLHDGQLRGDNCGIETGWLNAFRIPRADFEKARALGFSELIRTANRTGAPR